MELAQLLMFKEVAETGTINAAAQRLHRVPSNLTTRLKKLEDELGVDLFIREKMRLRLSAAGWTFLDYARRILELADEARLSISGGEPMGALTLGALESTAAARMSPVLAAFHRRFPQVLLDLSTGPSGDLIDRVLQGQLAGAFVDGPVSHPQLEGAPVFDEELVLISAEPHAPIRRARDVNGASIYAFRSNCSYRRLFEQWFQQDGAAPGRIYELESYHGMMACVSAGAGLALLPKSMLANMPNHGSVKVHKLDPAISKVSIHLIWRHRMRSPGLTALLEMLQSGEPA
ncbi:MAG: LysR substrate-binding domain-containing protein [Caulobacteraceae bacterium]